MSLLHAIEIANAVQAEFGVALMIFLTVYIAYDLRRKKFTVYDALRWKLSAPAQCVIAMWVFFGGNTLARGIAFVWRHMLNDGLPQTEADQMFLIPFLLGSVVAAWGMLCILRVFSEPWFGRRPWIITVAAAVFIIVLLAV